MYVIPDNIIIVTTIVADIIATCRSYTHVIVVVTKQVTHSVL